jgi:hypothetical protein
MQVVQQAGATTYTKAGYPLFAQVLVGPMCHQQASNCKILYEGIMQSANSLRLVSYMLNQNIAYMGRTMQLQKSDRMDDSGCLSLQ